MQPSILYEDEDLLIIDKPSGVIVNKADTTKGEETVQDWVETKYQISNIKYQIDQESDFVKRAGIVHRLDKETSGILLIAKNPHSFVELQRQFKEREVKKKYIALVHGEVKPEEGEIKVTVGRLPWNRKRFGVIPGGRESMTKYKVISNYTLDAINYTLVELAPLTGRTHQIRVHLKHLGFPIVSDPLYGGRKQARNDRKLLPRLFLHASEIQFRHPKTGKDMYLKSELPDDLQNTLSILEIKD